MNPGAELCTDCGICCDGTLFSAVSLEAASLAAARQHRLPVLETAHACKLELPCPALRGVLCEIYDERPEQCAEFACALLTHVAESRLSVADARAIIDETRATHERLAPLIGDTPWWRARRSAIEAARSDPAWAAEHANLMADLATMDELVHGHFLD